MVTNVTTSHNKTAGMASFPEVCMRRLARKCSGLSQNVNLEEWLRVEFLRRLLVTRVKLSHADRGETIGIPVYSILAHSLLAADRTKKLKVATSP